MKKRLLSIMLIATLGLAACKKSFTERPALDTPTSITITTMQTR